jgi:hypothetical protein
MYNLGMIKKTNKIKVTFYLEQHQIDGLKELAALKGFSVGLLIRQAVDACIKKENTTEITGTFGTGGLIDRHKYQPRKFKE